MAGRIRVFNRCRLLLLPSVVFSIALLLAGLGSAVAVMAQSTPSVTVKQTQYLADGAGKTLYIFSADTAGSGASACNGPCATPWPPFLAPGGTVTAPAGVSGTFAVFSRQDGTQQATYNGQPLYYFARDINPGDMNGQNVTAFGGTWTAATP